MNHLFANMQPGLSWVRHNWLFQDYEQVLHPYFPWSEHVRDARPDVYPQLPESASGWWDSKDLMLESAADVAASRRHSPLREWYTGLMHCLATQPARDVYKNATGDA